MRLGIFLPNVGPWAGPDALARVASRAEEGGFDSVWTTERLIVPLEPSAPYPAGDGRIPDVYNTSLDPLDSLTFVAGQTTRIGLGVSVLNLPWYNPALLARRLSTIDVLSNGRLRVGFGIGWSPDEYQAVGSDWHVRGRRSTEALQALKTIWTTDPVEFEGEFFTIPRSTIGPKPVQKPHPPIYMAAYTPPALERVARHSDGWNPVGIPPAAVGQMFDGIKAQAQEAGRDPSELELVMRGNVELTDEPLGDDRGPFTGTAEQIAADIAATKELGASQLIFDPTFDATVKSVDDYVARMELCANLAK
jgi:probable F420-dependent oxidoreductase